MSELNRFARPAGLEWEFLEQFYPDYSHCDEILRSDDMSYVRQEVCNGHFDSRPVTAESQHELCRLYPELDYRIENGFNDYVDTGLTYYQAQTWFDDELFFKAVMNAPASAVMPHTRQWAWDYEHATENELRTWYGSLQDAV